jgi:hypothetical protein
MLRLVVCMDARAMRSPGVFGFTAMALQGSPFLVKRWHLLFFVKEGARQTTGAEPERPARRAGACFASDFFLETVEEAVTAGDAYEDGQDVTRTVGRWSYGGARPRYVRGDCASL